MHHLLEAVGSKEPLVSVWQESVVAAAPQERKPLVPREENPVLRQRLPRRCTNGAACVSQGTPLARPVLAAAPAAGSQWRKGIRKVFLTTSSGSEARPPLLIAHGLVTGGALGRFSSRLLGKERQHLNHRPAE